MVVGKVSVAGVAAGMDFVHRQTVESKSPVEAAVAVAVLVAAQNIPVDRPWEPGILWLVVGRRLAVATD